MCPEFGSVSSDPMLLLCYRIVARRICYSLVAVGYSSINDGLGNLQALHLVNSLSCGF